MVRQGRRMPIRRHLLQQGFDELVQVVHLLEFAARILVQPPIPGEDV